MRAVVVTLVFGIGLVGCSTDDAPADDAGASATTTTTNTSTVAPTTAPSSESTTVSSTSTSSDPIGDVVVPVGFDSVAATVTTADGDVCELCLWTADTAGARAQGLMGVTDLGGRDGMAFVYDAPHTGSFWMKNTVLPLSIAFFDDGGAYLDAFDMEPCTADPCPRYPTAPDFVVAIETTQGDLADLGVGDGSRLVLTDLPCA